MSEPALLDDFDQQNRSRRWPRVLAWTIGGAVVAAGVYVGALWALADRVPPGTTIAGVDIGGMPADEAEASLTASLATATTEPIPVAVVDRRTSLDPVAAGLTFDAAATIDQVTGFGLEPSRLWRHVFGGGVVDPVTEVDEAALTAAVADVSAALDVSAVDGTVVFVDAEVVTTDPVAGTAVDQEAARDLVAAEWLTAPRPIELPTVATEPDIGTDELDAAVTDLARPLAAAPVAVRVDGQLAELPVSVLTEAASFTVEDGALALRLDGEALVDAVLARTDDLLSDAEDARFRFVDGKPEVVPGEPGTVLDPDVLAEAVATAATGGEDRTADVELSETDPAETTEELEALGVTEIVSEFDTPLTSDTIRTINIANGCSKLNGMLILPGETFSLSDALSPIEKSNGYVEAGVIVDGEHRDALGGGLSQVSTTTYNAAYFAGMELVEHTAHSEWFARYPEGREATIFVPTLDMKWRNNTPYGALLQAWVDEDDNSVHVRIWGTKYWTVKSETSGRWNVTSPTTVYSQSATCEPQSAGNPGFSVQVTRRVLLDGELVDKESWTTTYRAQNRIICGEEP